MTYNIRYDNRYDGDNWWGNRKAELVAMLDYYHPGILGIQEGLFNQVTYIDSALTNYTYIGVGREDGREKGEYAAVFYDTTMFECVENKTFWLSETPEVVSVGWDAALERICTYGQFIDKSTNDSLFVFNCHFDHKGKIAREMSAKLILEKIDEYGIANRKLIVMGDMNSVLESSVIQLFRKELNYALEISEQAFNGSFGTFNDFNTDVLEMSLCDYIFVKNLKIKTYRHITDRRKNNLYLSDHFPVLVELDQREFD